MSFDKAHRITLPDVSPSMMVFGVGNFSGREIARLESEVKNRFLAAMLSRRPDAAKLYYAKLEQITGRARSAVKRDAICAASDARERKLRLAELI